MEKTKNKTVSLGKNGKYYALGISIILVIAFLHFGLQMFFIQKENRRSVETAIEIAPPIEDTNESGSVNIEQAGEPETEIKIERYEAAKSRPSSSIENIKPKFRRQEEIAAPARISLKKKVVRETRAERLRRAEQILTGV